MLVPLRRHGKWHMALPRQAILTWRCWERWSIFLWTGDLLATSFFVREHTARGIMLRDRTSWSKGVVLMRWRRRRSMSRTSRREGAI